MSNPIVTLFYDGLCPLCSREIAHYRGRVHDDRLQFVDISTPGFDANRHGLDGERVHKTMHVKVGDEVRVGVAAFIAVWQVVPGYAWLARLATVPGIHGLMSAGYWAFARVRPWLPRRRSPICTTDVCQR